MSDAYEIYAVHYGHHDRVRAARISSAAIRMTCIAAARLSLCGRSSARTAGTFIVDTGFDQAMARKREPEDHEAGREGLKALGIDAWQGRQT